MAWNKGMVALCPAQDQSARWASEGNRQRVDASSPHQSTPPMPRDSRQGGGRRECSMLIAQGGVRRECSMLIAQYQGAGPEMQSINATGLIGKAGVAENARCSSHKAGVAENARCSSHNTKALDQRCKALMPRDSSERRKTQRKPRHRTKCPGAWQFMSGWQLEHK
jgi:hypothetical protein